MTLSFVLEFRAISFLFFYRASKVTKVFLVKVDSQDQWYAESTVF